MAHLVATTRLRAIVVGAGPAGLCAAAALSQDGHRVTVLERQPGLSTRGNALVIQPAAVKAVRHIVGAHDALRRVSVPNDELKWWSYGADKPFATSQAVDTRFDTDRVSAQKVFYDLAVKNGTEVRFGASVSEIRDGEQEAEVTTSEGETLQAEVIIGADGIKSTIRKQLFPDVNTDPILTREAIFLAKIPGSTMRASTVLSEPFGPGVTYGIVGPERFVLGRWLQGDVFGVQYVDVNHGEASTVDGNWNTPGDLAALRKRFDDFRPSIGALLDATESVEKWQIAYGPTLDTWQSPNNGRIVLLGDAAHAMIPHAAQGLSQGIEDSVSLARYLGYRDVKGGVAAAVERWVSMRKPRADMFVQRSINNAALRSLPDGPAQQARDRKIAEMASKVAESTDDVVMDMHAEQNSPAFQKWMKEYDVVREVDGRVMGQ